MAQTSASLVSCYLLLPSTSSSLSSPSPYHVPQELAARSRAWMPEKIFPRRRHPSEGESAAPRIFVVFLPPPSSISADWPTLSLSDVQTSIRSTKFFGTLFRSLSAIHIFLSSRQSDYINICRTICLWCNKMIPTCNYKWM